MTTGATGQLGLALPVQGELSGTWGDTVNNGITQYTNIAIAGTLSFAGDGAITLANTTGDSSATNIGSTTAQYMVIRVTGTQSVTKVITGPSYSKLYMVDHAGATSAVTFKAAGQSGVSIAVGEKCFVYYNGTDYIKVATSTAGTGSVTSVAATVPAFLSIAGSPITTSGTLAFTLSGTALPNTSGGTGQISAFTQYGVTYASTTTVLAITAAGTTGQALIATTSAAPSWGVVGAVGGGTGVANNAAMTVTGSGNFAYTRTLTGTTNVTFPTTGTLATLAGTETFTNKTLTNPTITNYTETPYSFTIVAGVITLALTNGTVQFITFGAANATITMPTATSGKSFTLFLKQDATGSRTVTWTTVSWPSATAPTLSSGANKLDKFVFTSDGTSWFGATAGQNYT